MLQERGHSFTPFKKSWNKLSIIIPAWNEEVCIVATVETILGNSYQNKEVIVINDGSEDGTLQVLSEKFKLYIVEQNDEQRIFCSRLHRELLVIDKKNSGKSDSMNLGIKIATGVYVASIDADTIVEIDAFQRAIVLLEEKESRKAVGGSVRILNGSIVRKHQVLRGNLPRAWLGMFQVIEYIRSFFGGRLGWEYFGGTALISGAFAVFRRDALLEIGGFDCDSVTEDFEIIVRMKKHFTDRKLACEFSMVPGPVCWTVVPESWVELFGQRVRWQRGLVKTIWKHKSLIFRRRYGILGLVTLPQMVIFEALSPVVEFVGYFFFVCLFYQNITAIGFIGLPLGIGLSFYILLTLGSIRLEEQHYARHDTKKPKARFIIFSIVEVFYYRQFLFAARLWGTMMALRRGRVWLKHERTRVEKKIAA